MTGVRTITQFYFLLNLKISGICILCIKIFHGIEYPDTSWYKSCFLVDFYGVCGGYNQNVGVLDNSSCTCSNIITPHPTKLVRVVRVLVVVGPYWNHHLSVCRQDGFWSPTSVDLWNYISTFILTFLMSLYRDVYWVSWLKTTFCIVMICTTKYWSRAMVS